MARDCIFCKIASGEILSDIVFRDDEVVAFRDQNPQAPLHVLVIPVEHTRSLADATDPELVGKLALAAARVARDAAYSDFRVVSNSGPGAGQSVFHLHFHLLAGRPMLWPPG